jgi:histone H3/H4
MSRTKRRPKRDLRAVFQVRPFPQRLRRLPLGRHEFHTHLQENLTALGTAVVFPIEVAATLYSATQAYLSELAGEAQLSAFCAGRTTLTRRDWLLAARMHKLSEQ